MNDIERYLYSYADAKKHINKLTDDMKQAVKEKDDLYIPPNMAVDPTKARVQKSEIGSPVERAVVLIVDKYWGDIDAIQDQMRHYRAIIDHIDSMLLTLDVDERNYITFRYLEDKSAEQTAELIGYEHAQAARIRKRALDKLEQYKSGA